MISTVEKLIGENTYPGRGIIVGKTPDGKKAAAAYFIMGRSENSRNRVFKEEGENVTIYPFDESKVTDPSLIIYSPLKVFENKLIITNGDQTDTIYNFLNSGESFEAALETRCFEPDAPNFTPRISAVAELADNDFTYKMSILKSADNVGGGCNRFCFSYEAVNGTGHFIHTYMHDGNPLPSFEGEPEAIEISDNIKEFAERIWNNLNEENKISLYVRYIDLHTGETENVMYNKHEI